MNYHVREVRRQRERIAAARRYEALACPEGLRGAFMGAGDPAPATPNAPWGASARTRARQKAREARRKSARQVFVGWREAARRYARRVLS